jgi:UDP-glucose 4-epimerase
MSNGIKVLVTGSSGFIGSHVSHTLQSRHYRVLGYDLADLRFKRRQDILNRKFLSNVVRIFEPNWIIHLAAQVFLKPSLEDPQNDAMLNIIGTLNVLEVARRYDCHVVYSSSGAVYGNNYQYPEPVSPYGVSKLTAERYCQLYTKLYNIPIVVFRFSSIYGKGRKPTSINLILEKALKDEVIEVTGNGEQTRDFTHVSDVVEAINMAVDGKFPSGIYDIGTGTSTSINELTHLIERLINKKITIRYLPAIDADPKRNELNVSKAAQYGFKAKISLTDGLKQLIEEMKGLRR